MNISKVLGLIVFGLSLSAPAYADDPKGFAKQLQGKSVTTVIPISANC
ncbi:MAG: hypothetical protein ABIO35_05275 [Nitrobacter sp.]